MNNFLRRSQPLRTKQTLLAVVLVGGAGAALLVAALAAGSFGAFEVESGVVSGPATVVAANGASGGSAVKFAAGTPTPTPTPTSTPAPTPTATPGSGACPAYPAHPDANCTGVQPGTVLTDLAAGNISDGGSYSGKRFSGGPTITASNITFTNCSFPNGAIFRSGTGITISHSDFGSDLAFSSSHTVNFTNNIVHNFSDGIDVFSDAGTTASNITLVENYVHTPVARAPDHSDGAQVRGVAGMTVRHNTFDMGIWYTDNGTNVLNSAFFWEDANGGNTGIVMTNNYLNGAGYTLYAPGGTGSITNNMFGPDYHFGLVYGTVDSRFTRSGNVTNTGAPVNF